MQKVRHHIIQRASNWTNHADNLHRRDQRTEAAYHTLFPWVMLPIERVQRILNLDSTAYNPEVIAEINMVVNEAREAREDAYNPECIKYKWLII